MLADDVPDLGVVNEVLAVNEEVAEGNDARVVWDEPRRLGIVAGQTTHRLANDLEVALHGGPQQRVSLVVRDDLTASDRKNELRRAPPRGVKGSRQRQRIPYRVNVKARQDQPNPTDQERQFQLSLAE